MLNWRENILKEFIPDVNKLTIVSDVDSLLSEEKLSIELRNKGFDIIEFDDPIEFRYAYESNYRTKWDKGLQTDLVVILRYKDHEIEKLPYDLFLKGRKLRFSLGDIFPNLSYPVIEKLERSFLDNLYEAQNSFNPGRLGDNATKDFILSHVFKIAPELINSDIDLLRILLRIHYSYINLPEVLSDRLVFLLEKNKNLKNWPFNKIISDNKKFFDFLQERWPVFLDSKNTGSNVGEKRKEYGLEFSGPELLPFDHQDIRIYIDNLFVEGKLKPIHENIETSSLPIWIKSGIASNESKLKLKKINRLIRIIEENLPQDNCKYKDWLAFALKFAELASTVYENQDNDLLIRYKELDKLINKKFFEWLQTNYSGLMQLPPLSPVMVHHIPRYLSRQIEDEDSKLKGTVLLVIDGLALEQWFSIKKILESQNDDIIIRDSAVFAWVPTITSVSRQAIFSGKHPFYFSNSINTTNNEEKLWKLFWENCGFKKNKIAYKRGLGNSGSIQMIEDVFHPETTKALGLVIDKVDKIMHGIQLGAAGMYNQVTQWGKSGCLSEIINYFLDKKFQVWLTSDHGNIEACGRGRPSEGVIAETRGERARIYKDHLLRKKIYADFKFSVEWSTNGLPENYYPLVAINHDAFIKENEISVGHGGVSLEEVIVPFAKIERK